MFIFSQSLHISRKKGEQSPTLEGVTPEFFEALGEKYPGSPVKNVKNALRLEIADKFERKACKFSAMTPCRGEKCNIFYANVFIPIFE